MHDPLAEGILRRVYDREPPESAAVPAFPLPREREPPSPYRERIPAPVRAAPAGRRRVVVMRPDPPGVRPPVVLSEPPRPAGPLDGLLRVLRPLVVFLGNHPYLFSWIVATALGLVLSWCGREIAHDHYNFV